MKYAAITSMNDDYYNKCGKYMLDSYKQHWKHLMPLYIYNEDFSLNDKDLIEMGWTLGNDYDQFQTRHKNNRVKTFAKKGFSIINAMESINCDYLVWLDADIIIKDTIDILDRIIKKNQLSAHFSVWHNKDGKEYHSCETGFFILNKKHEGFDEFYKTYKNIYLNDEVTGLRRFYDGEVYGKTVDLMSNKGFKMNNLNSGKHKTPIPRSILKDYIVHHKAGLKDRIQPFQ